MLCRIIGFWNSWSGACKGGGGDEFRSAVLCGLGGLDCGNRPKSSIRCVNQCSYTRLPGYFSTPFSPTEL